jgi:zinc transport system substrate-binding protein
MNRSSRRWTACLLPGLALLLLACGGGTDRPAEEPAVSEAAMPELRSTCFPAHWLVQRIAGDRVNAINVHPEGEDPPHWQPPAEIVAELADVDLIVVNGAGFEAWVRTASLPVSRIVDTSRGLELIEIEGATHSHGVNGEHSHAGSDPHTWSDPLLFLDQARELHAALVRIDPANKTGYDTALENLTTDLEELDREYAQVLSAAQGRHMAANHPAYNYLARRYGLDIHSFDFDPEQPASEEQLGQFSAWAAGNEQPLLLWESEPNPEVTALFPPEVRHVVIDPLEQPGGEKPYDYLSQARANIAIFGELFATP